MKFAYFGYREWAEDILTDIQDSKFDIKSFTTKSGEYTLSAKERSNEIDPKNLSFDSLKEFDAIMFYGWSWIVPKKIIDSVPCVCLHPSPLPKYRGGSPIQNQIMAGEDTSAVSLFKMGEELDDGPLYYQEPFSLEGDLYEVLGRMREVGTDLTRKLLDDFESGTVKEHSQDESRATYCKRRTGAQSEISSGDFDKMTARQIHDHIRSLQDPYPNAYITGSDGKKVYITGSRLEE